MKRPLLALVVLLCDHSGVHAETGYDGWLRYAPLDDAARTKLLETLPAVVVRLGDSEVETSAAEELIRGARGMTGRTLRLTTTLPDEPAIVLGTAEAASLAGAGPFAESSYAIAPEGFKVVRFSRNGSTSIFVGGVDDRGVLYGTFQLLSSISLGADLSGEVIASSNP